MRADDLGALAGISNDAVAAIPCNWPLTEAEFAQAAGSGRRKKSGVRTVRYERTISFNSIRVSIR